MVMHTCTVVPVVSCSDPALPPHSAPISLLSRAECHALPCLLCLEHRRGSINGQTVYSFFSGAEQRAGMVWVLHPAVDCRAAGRGGAWWCFSRTAKGMGIVNSPGPHPQAGTQAWDTGKEPECRHPLPTQSHHFNTPNPWLLSWRFGSWVLHQFSCVKWLFSCFASGTTGSEACSEH